MDILYAVDILFAVVLVSTFTSSFLKFTTVVVPLGVVLVVVVGMITVTTDFWLVLSTFRTERKSNADMRVFKVTLKIL